ncbi:MAG: twin-arginine translocase subunit TatB [Betaproteobacteria bacterium]|nr:twin-arginine translocase subunit TatB [Betaproteobacteria bacterium]MDE2132269.1 twin-arginine translocase subunit TatB [Betaproteobacteria bacterium]MDE2211292.1 twin-arginine translocase subunit TatB [Betaproteobacteria bacterium]
MLDFSVSEIGLIGVVALVAIGPERLPKVARAAGVLFGRFRRYAVSVKAEIDREIEQSELRELRKRMNEAAREAEQQVTASVQQAQQVLDSPAAPEPAVPASEPPAQAELAFQTADGTAAATVPSPAPAALPFGGDPFSVRPAGPLRSKPMTSASLPQTRSAGTEPEAM